MYIQDKIHYYNYLFGHMFYIDRGSVHLFSLKKKNNNNNESKI